MRVSFVALLLGYKFKSDILFCEYLQLRMSQRAVYVCFQQKRIFIQFS